MIGHRWKQRFIGEVNGQEVVFPAQWSIKEKKWQPYAGRGDWWYNMHKDWKTRSNFKLCAGCHSTGTGPLHPKMGRVEHCLRELSWPRQGPFGETENR